MVIKGYVVKGEHSMWYSGISPTGGITLASLPTQACILRKEEDARSAASKCAGRIFNATLTINDDDVMAEELEKLKHTCGYDCIICSREICPILNRRDTDEE